MLNGSAFSKQKTQSWTATRALQSMISFFHFLQHHESVNTCEMIKYILGDFIDASFLSPANWYVIKRSRLFHLTKRIYSDIFDHRDFLLRICWTSQRRSSKRDTGKSERIISEFVDSVRRHPKHRCRHVIDGCSSNQSCFHLIRTTDEDLKTNWQLTVEFWYIGWILDLAKSIWHRNWHTTSTNRLQFSSWRTRSSPSSRLLKFCFFCLSLRFQVEHPDSALWTTLRRTESYSVERRSSRIN